MTEVTGQSQYLYGTVIKSSDVTEVTGQSAVTVPVWNGNKKQWCAANPRGRTASALAKTDRDERTD